MERSDYIRHTRPLFVNLPMLITEMVIAHNHRGYKPTTKEVYNTMVRLFRAGREIPPSYGRVSQLLKERCSPTGRPHGVYRWEYIPHN